MGGKLQLSCSSGARLLSSRLVDMKLQGFSSAPPSASLTPGSGMCVELHDKGPQLLQGTHTIQERCSKS